MGPRLSDALRFFSDAHQYIRRAGLTFELNWQRQVKFESFSESDLLRESAWVILCSGFRESVVRRHFDFISLCFCDWESADAIVSSDTVCCQAASSVFRNPRKLHAISAVARKIHEYGFDAIKGNILRTPLKELQTLPYIGSITAFHLAKNLGLEVAKPDRHLCRLSQHMGFQSAEELCQEIAIAQGEAVRVVDLVLWRYIADCRPAELFPHSG